MTSIRLLVYLMVLLSAMPVGAQYYSNYPALQKPVHYLQSYNPEIRFREDQTQAAYLLILLNLLSPRDQIKPGHMAPPNDLRAIGLSSRLYGLTKLGKEKFSLESVRKELDLHGVTNNIMPQRLVSLQRDIAKKIHEEPNLQDIIKLAAISFVHPDPLVRIAAAPLLIVLTGDDKEALEELRRGTKLKDNQLSLLAATLLARFSSQDSALDQPAGGRQSGPGLEEEPNTTIVIHGTWASDQNWWRNGYPFFEYMEHDVPLDDLFLGDDPYEWSGNWSHDARKQAATALEAWANQHQENCLNLVAHSHGGNVGFLASNNIQFGRMILLSTPSHPHLYSPGNYKSLFSLRVHLDLVVLADGGGNEFPDWNSLQEKYLGWFNHSSTHNERLWENKQVPGWLTDNTCP